MFGSRDKNLQDKSVIERTVMGAGAGFLAGFLGGGFASSILDAKTLATLLPKGAPPVVKATRLWGVATLLGTTTVGLYCFGEGMAESIRHKTGPINAIYGTALASVVPLLYTSSGVQTGKFFAIAAFITVSSYFGQPAPDERKAMINKRQEEAIRMYHEEYEKKSDEN